MTTKVLVKQLAGEEDLLLGKGSVTQNRNGTDLLITKVALFKIVESEAELLAIDTAKFQFAKRIEDGQELTYVFNGSSWVRIETSAIMVVETFAQAKLVSGANLAKIQTKCHSVPGFGAAGYIQTGTTGPAGAGDEVLFYDASGTGWTLDYNYSSGLLLSQLGLVPDNVGNVDQKPIFIKGFQYSKHLVGDFIGSVRLGSTLKFTSNGQTIRGSYWAPYGGSFSIGPVASGFVGTELIDLSENATPAEGGQFNRLINLNINGRMADWKSAADPYVAVVGVKGISTRDCVGLENVSFRSCGIPFAFTGYIHWLKNIYVFQCYEGPQVTSTNSTSIDTYVIQTCAKNWGSLTNCAVHNATLQQGNEKQVLDDDIGVTCNGQVDFTGYFYTEGGNAQINVASNAKVTVDHAFLGFTIRTDGAFGHHNIRVATGSKILVNGGRKGGVSSIIVGGTPDSADTIHLDIDAYSGRIFNDSVSGPSCPNLFIRRPWGVHRRTNYHNFMEFIPVVVPAGGSAKIFGVGNGREGGVVRALGRGVHVRDTFENYFGDSTEDTCLWSINKRTASSGGNVLNMSGGTDGVLTAAATGTSITIYYSVESFGMLKMQDPATL